MKQIKITCKASDYAELESFIPTQGMLKELSEQNFNRLKNQILNKGFSAPLFVWKDKNKLKLLDGHQRLRVLTVLKNEGYTIPALPYAEIYADNEKQAAEKLLSFVSQYGKTTTDGLYEFINKFEIDKDFLNDLVIPELNIDVFTDSFLENNEPDDEGPVELHKQCPKCGHILNG